MKWYSSTYDIRGLDRETLNKEVSLNEEINELPLTQEQQRIFKSVVNDPKTGFANKCMSVYRDVIFLDQQRYDVCLSCGDYKVDGKIVYLTTEQKELLNSIKNN